MKKTTLFGILCLVLGLVLLIGGAAYYRHKGRALGQLQTDTYTFDEREVDHIRVDGAEELIVELGQPNQTQYIITVTGYDKRMSEVKLTGATVRLDGEEHGFLGVRELINDMFDWLDGNGGNENPSVTISVPPEATLSSLDVDAARCRVALEGVEISNEISADCADLQLELKGRSVASTALPPLSLSKLDIDAASCRVVLEGVVIGNEISADCADLQMTLKNGRTNKVDVDSASAYVQLDAFGFANMDLDGMDISVIGRNMPDNSAAYGFDCDSVSYNVVLNGQSLGGKSNKNAAHLIECDGESVDIQLETVG